MARALGPLQVLPATGFVRESQLVGSIVPCSRATLWRWVKAGSFPQPVKLSEGVTAWPVDAVRTWIEERTPAAA